MVMATLRALRRLLIGRDYRPPPDRRAPRLWKRWRPVAIPLLLFATVGLSFAAAQFLQENREMAYATSLFVGFFTVLPVLLAYHRPLTAWRLGFVGLFVGVINVGPTESWPWNPVQIFAFLLILGALALFAGTGVVAWAALITLIPVFLYVQQANAYGVAALFLAVLVVGDQIRRRRTTQRALLEQAEVSELEKARRAVLEERTRIAREMHDVVAHHMSMIAVQAETAPFRLGELPEPARAEFVAIAGSARDGADRHAPVAGRAAQRDRHRAHRTATRPRRRSGAGRGRPAGRRRGHVPRTAARGCRPPDRRGSRCSPRTGSCRRRSRTPPATRRAPPSRSP